MLLSATSRTVARPAQVRGAGRRSAAVAFVALSCSAAALAAPAIALAAPTAPAAPTAALANVVIRAEQPSAASRVPPVVGKMYTWVRHMPATVYRRGRALKFIFSTKQTSHDVVWLQFYIGMFDASTNASAHSENRGVTLRWYDPVSKRWRKAIRTDPTGGWTLGPPAGFTIKHDQVLRIPVKIWFGKRAWLGVHQLEAIVNDYSISTPSGKPINAVLWMPNTPQYRFDVRR
jgi:hypothetical protein